MADLKTIVLTRESGDNYSLSSRLYEFGFTVVHYPCIETVIYPFEQDWVDGDPCLEAFDVVAFTSKRGVVGMKPAADRILTCQAVLAAVGNRTALEILDLFGRTPAIIPEKQTGENLAEAIIEYWISRTDSNSGFCVLHVRGKKANPRFREILSENGINVFEQIVYETRIPPLKPLPMLNPGIVVFASPSAVKGYFSANPETGGNLKWVAIGPVTARALESMGITEYTESVSPDTGDIVAAIRDVSELPESESGNPY